MKLTRFCDGHRCGYHNPIDIDDFTSLGAPIEQTCRKGVRGIHDFRNSIDNKIILFQTRGSGKIIWVIYCVYSAVFLMNANKYPGLVRTFAKAALKGILVQKSIISFCRTIIIISTFSDVTMYERRLTNA